jgi:hypothetical protein
VAALLVVVSSISVLASVIAVWVHQTVFDTDSFMETIDPILEDPQLKVTLGDFVTEEVTGALDLEQRLQEPLANLDAFLSASLLELLDVDQRGRDLLGRIDRPTLVALAGPIADRFDERIAGIVDNVMASPEVAELIPQLVRRAHEASVALVRGDLEELPNVSVEEGEVRLNLLPVVATVMQPVVEELRDLLPDLQLPDNISTRVDEAIAQFRETLGDRVPDDFGQVTVMSEDRLTAIQATADRIDRWVWGLVVLTVILVALTLVVSPTRRRTTIQLGIGVIAAFLIGTIVLNRLEEAVIDEIADPDGGQTAFSILGHLLAGLRGGIIAVIVIATLVAIGFYIAGRPEWVTTTGARMRGLAPGDPEAGGFGAWVAARYDTIRLLVVALAVLVLFLTGLDLLAVVIVGALLALSLWWLARARDKVAVEAEAPPT